MKRKRVIRAAIVGLLTIQTCLLVHSAKVHSPTWDEVGHLAAGISHWELGRFELYSVNPPLVRTIAAAPVYFVSEPEMDWSFYRRDPKYRSEVFLGRKMIDQNGEQSFQMFFLARLALIPIALLGGSLCYLWGRDLFGPVAGLIALTIWTFSPNVLAYGSLITPDLSSTVALIGCSYLFWRWMKEPTIVWSVSLGGALALAMLTKSVWLMLPPLFMAIWIGMNAFRKTRGDVYEIEHRITAWLFAPVVKQSCRLVVTFLVAFVLVNGFYGFHGSLRPLGGYEFVSSAFSGNAAKITANPECSDCMPLWTVEPGNRFSGHFLGKVPVPLPQNYLAGIDIQTQDFERGFYDPDWQSYLMGTWQQGGWWYYYLLGLLVKVPLATWILVGAGSIAALFWRPDKSQLLGVVCLWTPAIVFFAVVSAMTGLNRYVRYALPLLPILFVWASQIGRLLERDCNLDSWGQKLRGVGIALACVWLGIASLWHAPGYLAYFNEIAGGSRQGHKVLCDSNLDWGQDLRYFADWVKSNPDKAENVSLAYFGAFDPISVGIDYLPTRPLLPETRTPIWRMGPQPGWHVISKNYLVGHAMPVPDGHNIIRFRSYGPSAFSYFNAFEPVDQIGSTLVVYHLSNEEVKEFQHQWVAAKHTGTRGKAIAEANEDTWSNDLAPISRQQITEWVKENFSRRQHG